MITNDSVTYMIDPPKRMKCTEEELARLANIKNNTVTKLPCGKVVTPIFLTTLLHRHKKICVKCKDVTLNIE